MSQTIWIARHANRLDFVNPDWFLTAERRYDPPLSEDGWVQAQQLANRLKGESISHIFASPFLRTVQTANAVASVLDLPIKLETGLSEWLNPDWMSEAPQRLSTSALAEKYPLIDISYTPQIAVNYPETREKMRQRSAQTARCLVQDYSQKDILLVAHGASVLGASMGLVGDIAIKEVKASLCSLVKIVRQESEWLLELTGDTSHLTEVEEVVRFN